MVLGYMVSLSGTLQEKDAGSDSGCRARTARVILRICIGEAALSTLLSRISITPGLRSGQPCIRGLRITVLDILRWLGTGATHAQIVSDYPELCEEDILAALEWAAVVGHRNG